MENPFKRQAEYHKKEMKFWRIATIIAAIILVIAVIVLFKPC